ncbi:MAG: hypothetical protein O7G87_11925 [bacterium]|nr:hypothetical protein [bacterium]
MSIRTLTIRLMEEAEEARRHRNFTATRSQPEPEQVLGTAEKPTPKSLFPSSSRAQTPNIQPEPAPAPSTRQVGIRPRPQEQPSQVPGGIAARFKVSPDKYPVETPEPHESEGEAQLAAPQDTAEPVPEVAQTTEETESPQEEAAPITIELKSH